MFVSNAKVPGDKELGDLETPTPHGGDALLSSRTANNESNKKEASIAIGPPINVVRP